MANPAKFKSVSVNISTYKVLKFLGAGKVTNADLTVRNMDTKMEKRKTICPQCKGNGYVKALLEEGREEVIADCNKCDNQGEISEQR
jgi:DnaJ-class molecular chaperone